MDPLLNQLFVLEKSTLWVSPQDYMDEIRQETQASSPSKKKQKQSTVGLWCHGISVKDQNLYFGLGPIPKPKPKLADTFGRYLNRY